MLADPHASTVDVEPHLVECVGHYELVRRLGSGGMAEVHLARVAGLEGFEKLLVLKRILPHLSADPHFVKMFLAEARLAALLDHPNVVQVYDLGCDDGDYYFVMEFVYGENLQSLLRSATRAGEDVPLSLAVSIVCGAAAGLHFAHERVGFDGQPLGIVHRDVSPTNVMVTYDGFVKVADFGIAKVTNRTDVTRAGTRKGKVPYMSPEQCRAEKLDRRSDIFALGILLHECTTMTRLFDGDNEFGVMNRIVNGDIPPPSSLRPGYPKELERIVMRALTVDKERRYATALELQRDLESFAREQRLDGSARALGEWMHRMFAPRPFPWGALMDGRSEAAMLSTAVEDGSSHSMSHDGPASDVTAASTGPANYLPPAPRDARPTRSGTLRGVAIGLSSVAALSVVGVLGLFLARGGDASDEETSPAAVEPPPADDASAQASTLVPEQPAAMAAPPPPQDGARARPAQAVSPPGGEALPEEPDPQEVDRAREEGEPSGSASSDDSQRSRRGKSRRGKRRPAKKQGADKEPDLDAFFPQ